MNISFTQTYHSIHLSKIEEKKKIPKKVGCEKTIETVSNAWCVQHLHCLFTQVFTHCHQQLMGLRGRAACPLLWPQTLTVSLWVPNWAYHPTDWINSLVPGNFTPTARGDSFPLCQPDGGGKSKGSRAQSCQNVSKAWPFLLAKPS